MEPASRRYGFQPEMGNSNSGAGVNSGVGAFLLRVVVELELALFSNSDSTPIDLMTSKRTTKKLHRCPQRWATPTQELELKFLIRYGVGVAYLGVAHLRFQLCLRLLFFLHEMSKRSLTKKDMIDIFFFDHVHVHKVILISLGVLYQIINILVIIFEMIQ